MEVQIDLGDVFAGCALLLAMYATFATAHFNRRQKSLIESQERLNNLLLEKEQADSLGEKRADLGASLIKVGSQKYRVKIWNQGKCTARNVRVEFPDGNDLVIQNDVDAKFPLEALATHQPIELIASVHMGTKAKHTIKLIWEDDRGSDNQKVVYLTL